MRQYLLMRKSFSMIAALLPLLAFAATQSGCSHAPTLPPDVPTAQGLAGQDAETVVILGTNDIHGALAPMKLKTREPEGTQPQDYEAGGVAYLASYIRVLRTEFGRNLVWLDGGDEFQGTIESNSAKGAPMVEFFDRMGLQAAAVGNHEFDYGPLTAGDADVLGSIKARMQEARYPYVAANMVDKATGRVAPLPDSFPSVLLQAGRLKVGVIGLSTIDTPRTTRADYVRSLAFTDEKEATLREAASLRKQGADLVVLTGHLGGKCERGRVSAGASVRKATDPQGECGSQDEVTELLRSLPPGTVDAVVAGHTHQIMHHWINGVPVIQGGSSGRYFNLVYLTYDVAHKKLLTDLTRIEGPVPVCPAVFQNQGDCNGDRAAPKVGRGPLVPLKFHGEVIRADSEISGMLKPVYARTDEIKKKVYGQAARPVEHERFKESELGDLVADSLREAAHADVALMNSGGVRAPWEQGPITYEEIFRSLPFDNAVVTLQVTGKELKTVLRIAESGSRGFFSVSGVKLRLIALDEDAPSSDLNGDGRIEPWEIDRLIEARLEDGSPIRDDRTYRLATLDFLVKGGDDLGWIMSRIPDGRKLEEPGTLVRDSVVQHLTRLASSGPINSAERPIVDGENPRFKFEKPGSKKKRKHRRKHRG